MAADLEGKDATASPGEPGRPTSVVDDEQRLTDVRRPAGASGLLKLSGPVVGIDLGTSNSCVAISRFGEIEVIPGPGGHPTTPSIVYLPEDGPPQVGHTARDKLVLAPDRGIVGSKRFLGRPFASKEVNSLAHFTSYEMVRGEDGRVAARVGDRMIRLEEVAGVILAVLKEVASDRLGTNVQRAVVTVPAYFGETQRQAVRDAGRIAGLHVERILNEPTAAAVAYGAGRGLRRTILVYDLGGGTFDASVLRVEGNRMEVLATDGDPFLGGSDFDDRLTEWVLMTFERETGVSLRDQPVPVQRVRFAAETAKIELSSATSRRIHLPFIAQLETGPIDLEVEVTRQRFDELTRDLIERTLAIVQGVLDAAKIPSRELDDVILVGGQSRSPAVADLLCERFGQRPCKGVHPDEAVALGAAMVAELLDSDAPLVLVDVLGAAIRIGTPGGGTMVLLEQGITLPAQRKFNVPLLTDPRTYNRLALYRGNEELGDENTLLGFMRLPAVAPTNDEQPTARLTVQVTAEGLLSVFAELPGNEKLAELQVLL